MKYLIILIFLFSTVVYAQNPATSTINKSGLTPTELEATKDMYLKMMQSDTYIKLQAGTRAMNKKFKNVKLPKASEFSGVKDSIEVKDRLKVLLAKDIGKTNFKSLDEAVDTMMGNILLTQKLLKENLELYTLLPKATKDQFKEILEPERQRAFDSLVPN
ncbi:hypothetical protein AAEO56_05400 [Flavobacterium sp. DGU11]|uniref:DUF4142 domain-containing protein n=1 Tax=Flavobacterium arundinis TaxID=3139143 RepID=A0ABU9HU55_9FLAO